MGKRIILVFLLYLLPAAGTLAVDQNYMYDDGTADTCTGGIYGDVVWMHHYDPQGGSETITHVGTAFGSTGHPTGAMPTSNVVYVYIWDDPNNDGDPTDAVLLGSGHGYLRHLDTDIFTHYPLDEPVQVTSRFFVGVRVKSMTDLCWPAPLDTSQQPDGRAWIQVDLEGDFNPYDLTENTYLPQENDMGSNPGVWLLRAHRMAPDVDCHSFDETDDESDIPGWTELAGDWWCIGRQLASEATAIQQVITRDATDLADGCLEFNGSYGAGASVRYVGAVVRYVSLTDRILVKLQDNSNVGYFDSCFVYDNSSTAFQVFGQNFGTDPKVQLEFAGTEMRVRIDVDRDGNWERDYPVTVTTTQSGAVGAAAYNQCFFDDWCCGPSPDAWGGTLIDFENIPETFWYFGGNQNLGSYYEGLTFTPDVIVLESSVYGYGDSAYPWHSFESLVSSGSSAEMRVDFDEEMTHVGVWYTSANGDGWAEAFDGGGMLVDRAVLLDNAGRNNYASLDGAGIRYVIFGPGQASYTTLDDLEYRPANSPSPTVNASFSCPPGSGTLPFAVTMNTRLTNTYDQQVRRFSCHIDLRLASGTQYNNWRAGFTNVAPGSSYVYSWPQNFPMIGSLVGINRFDLFAEDVTPAPYNQPPYPPAGDTDQESCLVTAYAP